LSHISGIKNLKCPVKINLFPFSRSYHYLLRPFSSSYAFPAKNLPSKPRSQIMPRNMLTLTEKLV
jgi:hypothetical protein